jgi:hypothetical protein
MAIPKDTELCPRRSFGHVFEHHDGSAVELEGESEAELAEDGDFAVTAEHGHGRFPTNVQGNDLEMAI